MKDIIQVCLLVLGLLLLIYFSFFYKKENFITKLMNKNKNKERDIIIEDFEGKNDPVNQKMNINTENYSITEKYDSPKKQVQLQDNKESDSESVIMTEDKEEESINLNIFENNNDNIKLVRNNNNNNKYDTLNEGYMSEVQMAPFSEAEKLIESEAQEDFNIDLANDDFIQSNYFKEKKEGYVFKKGKKGLGYYLDNYNGNLKNSP
jgi:hypothetical protein